MMKMHDLKVLHNTMRCPETKWVGAPSPKEYVDPRLDNTATEELSNT